MYKNVCMRTVLLLMCSTAGPMARGASYELEGTSLAIAQAKVQPVLALEPMFRVLTVLRRYVPSVCRRRPSELDKDVV